MTATADAPAPDARRQLRRVIHISAYDSPNVQRALAQQARGEEPDGREVLEGVVSWFDLTKRLRLWDEVMKCIGIHGRFWRGSESMMFPPDRLNESARLALHYKLRMRHPDPSKRMYRRARGLGCDPGEGGDPNRLGTAWAVVDEWGLLELVNMRTTDTSVITKTTKMLLRKWHLEPRRCCFDRGGGGKQIADHMRDEGYDVQTVAFGAPPGPEPRYGSPTVAQRKDIKEDAYSYMSNRVRMYHQLALALDPGLLVGGGPEAEAARRRAGKEPDNIHRRTAIFAIPAGDDNPDCPYRKLRHELAPVPLLYDRGEGRLYLPPKHRSGRRQAGQEQTMTERIGWSPDISDALVLAYEAMVGDGSRRSRAGAMRYKEAVQPNLDDYSWTNPS